MYALVTGATSGMGKDMAVILSQQGYDIIAVGRREERLNELRNVIKTNLVTYQADISNVDVVKKMYEDLKQYDIEILINNAGFGYLSMFDSDNIDTFIQMVNTNVVGAMTLMSLYLTDFKKKNKGYILNVASAAAFTTGPLLGVYYATKSFLYKLTLSTYEELRREKSKVHLSCLCPGPVSTEFDEVAKVKFSLKAQSSSFVSNYAIKKMFKNKLIIIPSRLIRVGKFFSRFLSEKRLAKIGYNFQKKKK